MSKPSILSKFKNLNKATSENARVPMTDLQVVACKAHIKKKNLGYNVQPNKFDIKQPYRIGINFEGDWVNFGNFTQADVAAAIGTIVSAAYFGVNAVAGNFDEKIVEADPEYIAWIADERNSDVILRSQDPALSIQGGGVTEENPF